MAYTYIHEMMHAYDDSDRAGNSPNVIEYAEEPLAEYGMLHFLASFASANPQYQPLFRQAFIGVQSKQKCVGLAHYGFGAYLYRCFAHVDWETKMLAAKNKVHTADNEYKQLQHIFQTGYPSPLQRPATAQLLYDILFLADNQPSQSIVPMSQPIPVPSGNILPINPTSNPALQNQMGLSLFPVYTIEDACDMVARHMTANPIGWMFVGGYTRVNRNRFIVRAFGHSMEPRIQDGEYCMFETYMGGSREGKIILAEHPGKTDADYEGPYSIKEYHSQKTYTASGGWACQSIELRPLNPAYDRIVITPDNGDDFIIVAEFIDTI